MLNVKRIPVTLTRMYIYWFIENNVELDAKLKFKFLKILWRHQNMGIIRFYVRYVIDCKQYQNESSSFVYTPDIEKYWSVAVNRII